MGKDEIKAENKPIILILEKDEHLIRIMPA